MSVINKPTGESFAQLMAEKDRPKVDVWFGGTIDPHLQAADSGLLQEYRSPSLPQLHPWAQNAAKVSGYRTVGLYSEVLGIAYNTDILQKKKLPTPSGGKTSRCPPTAAKSRSPTHSPVAPRMWPSPRLSSSSAKTRSLTS